MESSALMLTVYGLKNCDTCRKARKWLDSEGIAHRFHDVRDDGIGEADVARWTKAVGLETLLNRRGTTWRGLSERDRKKADSGEAVAVMASHAALIKRPVFEAGRTVVVGFGKPEQAAVKKLAGG